MVVAMLLAACSPPNGDEPGDLPLDTELALPITAGDAETAARAVLDGADDLRVTSVRHSLTGEHVRFTQIANDGTPVLGVETSVHLRGAAPNYTLRRIHSTAIRPLQLDGRRDLNRTAAIAAALTAAHHADPAQRARALSSEPVVRPTGPALGRPGWRVVIATTEPVHEWEIFVDGETAIAEILRDQIWFVDGSGYVYRPNPMSQTGLLTFADDNDADSAALTSARRLVTLPGLDGSGSMVGDYADVRHSGGYLVDEPSLVFDFTRSQDEFEEVSAYYHIDHAQRNLQLLGFDEIRTIADFPIDVFVNATSQDNSWYSPGDKSITFGYGGVDDAEDGDIIIHEYGHGIMADIVPGFGLSGQAGAIGEAYSDMLAVSTPTNDDDLLDRACVGAWDATSYASDTPPCLRRVDGAKHYPEHWANEVHDDGEIWTGTMWEMYTATGLGRDGGLQLLTEAAFSFSASESFAQSANAIIAADGDLHGGAHAAALTRVLLWHGLLATISPEADFPAPAATFATSVASPSAIPNSADGNETISHPGATAIRVHFASFNMKSGDNTYLYDGAGLLYAIHSGNQGSFTSVAVPGDTIVIRWVTNRTNQSTGWTIDSYEISTANLPDAGLPPDAAVVFDAAVEGVDAAVEVPDADVGVVDATVEIPDADVEVPDAEVSVPDADVGVPDADLEVPDAAPGVPDADVGAPDADVGVPDAALVAADAAMGVPDAALVAADAAPGVDSTPQIDARDTGSEAADCGCTTSGNPRGSAGSLLLIAMVALARRRRWV